MSVMILIVSFVVLLCIGNEALAMESSQMNSLIISCCNGTNILNCNYMAPDSQSKSQSSISILSYASDNIMTYAKWSFALTTVYAKLHNYMFLKLFDNSTSSSTGTSTTISSTPNVKPHQHQHAHTHTFPEYYRNHNYEPRDQRWNKIKILWMAMNEAAHGDGDGHVDENRQAHNIYQSEASVLVWIDADLVLLDMKYSIENLLSLYPTADLIVSRDSEPSSGLINTGFMIFRKSSWSRDFLYRWWNQYDR